MSTEPSVFKEGSEEALCVECGLRIAVAEYEANDKRCRLCKDELE